MITHKDIEKICDVCKDGYKPKGLGRTVPPNPHHDFHGFAEWLSKKSAKRVVTVKSGTISQYVRHLSKIQEPITEDFVRNFTTFLDQYEKIRRQYKTNTHKNLKSWVSHFDTLPDHKKEANISRFQYKMYLSLKNYLEYMGKDDWVALLPPTKSISKPSRYIKTEYLKDDEFNEFMKHCKNEQLKVFYKVLYWSGARFGEIAHCKKTTKWFPSYRNNYIELNLKVLFKITIPDEFVKRRKKVSAGYQNLYIDDKDTIKVLVDHLNTNVRNNGYVFNFVDIEDERKGKQYKDIEREKIFIRNDMDDVMRSAGFDEDKIAGMTIHGFRRSMIHRVQDEFKQIELTQKRARHSTTNQTGDYLAIGDRELEKVLLDKMQKG